MRTQFILVFYLVFAALSLAYLLVQRRHARFVWVPVYLLLVYELGNVMLWSNYQLANKRLYLDVGHASIVLVEVWVSWVLMAVFVMLASWFSRVPKSGN
jgi:hypothetical protein